MKKQKYLILILFLLFSGLVFARPVLVAHRGANQEADENTIKAYQLAIDYRVDYIECDPRLTRDGVFIIMHDPEVDRTTNGTGRVADMTLKQIQRLRTKNGERVPTLKQVLEWAKKNPAGVYLDTKEPTVSALEKMVQLVKETGMEKQVIFGLWHLNQLKWLESNYPKLVSCISYPWPPASLKRLKKLGADWVGTLTSLATRTMLNRAHRLGLKVITMPINDPEVMKKKLQAGLDALQTDDPKIFYQINLLK